jgi:hypothetical protein
MHPHIQTLQSPQFRTHTGIITMAHLTREEVLKSGEVAPEYRKVRSILSSLIVLHRDQRHCRLSRYTNVLPKIAKFYPGFRSSTSHNRRRRLLRPPRLTSSASPETTPSISDPKSYSRVRHRDFARSSHSRWLIDPRARLPTRLQPPGGRKPAHYDVP